MRVPCLTLTATVLLSVVASSYAQDSVQVRSAIVLTFTSDEPLRVDSITAAVNGDAQPYVDSFINGAVTSTSERDGIAAGLLNTAGNVRSEAAFAGVLDSGERFSNGFNPPEAGFQSTDSTYTAFAAAEVIASRNNNRGEQVLFGGGVFVLDNTAGTQPLSTTISFELDATTRLSAFPSETQWATEQRGGLGVGGVGIQLQDMGDPNVTGDELDRVSAQLGSRLIGNNIPSGTFEDMFDRSLLEDLLDTFDSNPFTLTAPAGESRGLFVNISAHVQAMPFTQGDFNLDGAVDLLDYVQWRDNLNSPTDAPINNLGDDFGSVSVNDYTFFKSRFGEPTRFGVSGGAGQLVDEGAEIPEPGSATLLIVVLAIARPLRRIASHTRGD